MHESLVLGHERISHEQNDESLEKAFRGMTSVRQIPAFGQIVAGLVRRFRTPVSSIEGALWLIEDNHLNEEKHGEFIRIIRRESHQLERALSDIQEFTQPRKPRMRRVDLSHLLDEVIELAGPGEQRNIFLFRKEMPSSLPLLNCDPELITKMLLNLAMNAIQATPEGGQLIWTVQAGEDRVTISLRDFGRGIPTEVAGRIFDPFFTTRESGLGLGLTVARQIAVTHSGTIAVDSISERGTSISVVLPLNRSVPR
jgi:two-component system sensor histidine kinase HydH